MAFLRGTARAVLVCVFVFLSGIVILLLFFLVSNNTPDFGLVGRAGMLSWTAHERRPLEPVCGLQRSRGTAIPDPRVGGNPCLCAQ